MHLDLKPGRQVLHDGIQGVVLEVNTSNRLVVDLVGVGIVTLDSADVIAIASPEEVFGKSEIAKIPDDKWKRAEDRANVIRDLSVKGGITRASVASAAKRIGISERQLWREIAKFRRQPLVSAMLPLSGGRDEGTRILDARVERIIGLRIEDSHLTLERPTYKALHERVTLNCIEAGLNPPCYKTVANRVKDTDNREAQKKRIGAKAARYRYQPMPRHVDASEPLERVEIDHTPMDLMVRSDDPACDYIGRPWLTVAVDVFTRCVLGIHIGFEAPSVLSVALCLTHAVLPKNPAEEFGVPLDWPFNGLPREIVVDNGKDFVSDAFRRSCHEYGIILTHRPVGSPHYGGTIERLIGTLIGQCHMLPGTTKNSTRVKGDYDSAKHAVLTLSQARRWFVEQLLGRYHLKEHRSLRIPPAVAWRRAMGGQDAA